MAVAEQELGKKVLNLLMNTEKQTDFRFDQATRKLQRGEMKTIYWVGTIILAEVKPKSEVFQLHFTDLGNGRMIQDTFVERHEDGAPAGRSIACQFEFKDLLLKKQVLEAKKARKKYFHLIIEEEVHSDGEHTVHFLYDVDTRNLRCGFASMEPLNKMSLSETYWLSGAVTDTNTKKVCIGYHGPYRWMK